MTEQQKLQRDKLTEQVFEAKSAYRALTTSVPESALNTANEKPLLLNELRQWLMGSGDFNTPYIMGKINQSLALRGLYQQLLNTQQFAFSDKQAAASSNVELPERVAEQFKLKFKRDKFNPEQVFVILFIEHGRPAHNHSEIQVHIAHESLLAMLAFPPLVDGKSQLLMETESDAFKLLANSQSQITLI